MCGDVPVYRTSAVEEWTEQSAKIVMVRVAPLRSRGEVNKSAKGAGCRCLSVAGKFGPRFHHLGRARIRRLWHGSPQCCEDTVALWRAGQGLRFCAEALGDAKLVFARQRRVVVRVAFCRPQLGEFPGSWIGFRPVVVIGCRTPRSPPKGWAVPAVQ